MTVTEHSSTSYTELTAGAHETCNPEILKYEIMELLKSKGLHPELPAGTGRQAMAGTATSTLLRAFGILPAGGAEVIDRRNAPDER